jgi:hypothetical protein
MNTFCKNRLLGNIKTEFITFMYLLLEYTNLSFCLMEGKTRERGNKGVNYISI